MMKMLKKKRKGGFTLIELIVVIVILGILAAIAVPRVLGFRERAEEQADKQTAVQVRNALALLNANGEIYVATTGQVSYSTASAYSSTGIGNLTETLLETLTGDIDVVGTKPITVTIDNEGAVEVTSP